VVDGNAVRAVGEILNPEESAMTIEISQPEVEAIIHQRMESGIFKDAEEVILHALRSSPEPKAGAPATQSVDQVFAKVRGLLSDEEVDTLFRRKPSTSRLVDFE
jgi:hypothetical protein